MDNNIINSHKNIHKINYHIGKSLPKKDNNKIQKKNNKRLLKNNSYINKVPKYGISINNKRNLTQVKSTILLNYENWNKSLRNYILKDDNHNLKSEKGKILNYQKDKKNNQEFKISSSKSPLKKTHKKILFTPITDYLNREFNKNLKNDLLHNEKIEKGNSNFNFNSIQKKKKQKQRYKLLNRLKSNSIDSIDFSDNYSSKNSFSEKEMNNNKKENRDIYENKKIKKSQSLILKNNNLLNNENSTKKIKITKSIINNKTELNNKKLINKNTNIKLNELFDEIQINTSPINDEFLESPRIIKQEKIPQSPSPITKEKNQIQKEILSLLRTKIDLPLESIQKNNHFFFQPIILNQNNFPEISLINTNTKLTTISERKSAEESVKTTLQNQNINVLFNKEIEYDKSSFIQFSLSNLYFLSKNIMKDKLIKILNDLKIKHRNEKKNSFKFICEKNILLQFEVLIDNTFITEMSIIKFKRINGNKVLYDDIINKICKKLNN